jgi:hypothetical protein
VYYLQYIVLFPMDMRLIKNGYGSLTFWKLVREVTQDLAVKNCRYHRLKLSPANESENTLLRPMIQTCLIRYIYLPKMIVLQPVCRILGSLASCNRCPSRTRPIRNRQSTHNTICSYSYTQINTRHQTPVSMPAPISNILHLTS